MAENAVPYDYIIDADGLKESVTLLRTVDRYMESIQRRVDRLSRMRVVIPIRLSDCLCEPIKRIRENLESLTKSRWIVSVTTKIDLALDPSIFIDAGRNAGKSFNDNFEAALDPKALLAKVKAALESMQLKITVSGAKDKEENKGGIFPFDDDDYKDMLKDTISGALGGMLGSLGFEGLKMGKNGLKKLFKKADSSTSPDKPNNPNKALVDPQGNPLTSRKSFTTRFKELGKSTIGFGKNTIALGKKAIEKTKNWMNDGSGNGIVPSNNTPTNSIPEKRSLPSSEKSQGFSSPKRGFTGTSSQRTLSQAINSPVPKLVESRLLKTAGKWIKPLGYIATAASIATAKPGEERNKQVRGAVGNAAGTAIGAALGSIVPGAGTLAGGLIGGYVGEKLAEGKVGKAVQGWVSSGSKWVRGLGKKKSKHKETTPDEIPVSSDLNTTQENRSVSKGPVRLPVFSPVNVLKGVRVDQPREATNLFQGTGHPNRFAPATIFAGNSASGTTIATAPKPQPGVVAGIGAGAGLGRLGGSALGQTGLLGGLLPIVEWFKARLNAPSGPAAVGVSAALPLSPGNAQRLPLTPTMQSNSPRQPANPPAPTININIPAGAVQLTVKETEIDYNAITAQVSTRLTASIRQTLENRP